VAGAVKLRTTPPNPLRSEAGAFGFLVWFLGVLAIVVVVSFVIRAL
jgi:hypothetical protein